MAVGIYRHIKQKQADALFQQFAISNGFSFKGKTLPDKLKGDLSNRGSIIIFAGDLVNGTIRDRSFVLFNCKCKAGSDDHSYTYYNTTLRLEYSSSFPPILMEYKTIGPSPFSGVATKKIELEGDFNKYFNLYTKKGFEVETLKIFSPDFMAKILDNWKGFSLEFVEDQVYIYCEHLITKKEELEKIYQFAQYLVSKISQ